MIPSTEMTLLLAQAPAQNPQGQQMWMMVPLILAMVAFWALTSSSQRKRTKQHEQLLKGLKAGDKVTTSSGIIGVIVSVKDRSVSLRSADSKLEVLKSAIADVLARDGSDAEVPAPQA